MGWSWPRMLTITRKGPGPRAADGLAPLGPRAVGESWRRKGETSRHCVSFWDEMKETPSVRPACLPAEPPSRAAQLGLAWSVLSDLPLLWEPSCSANHLPYSLFPDHHKGTALALLLTFPFPFRSPASFFVTRWRNELHQPTSPVTSAPVTRAFVTSAPVTGAPVTDSRHSHGSWAFTLHRIRTPCPNPCPCT